MNSKKELWLVVAALLLVLSLINSFLLITGNATSTATGEVSICLNNPPVFLNLADQTAIVGQLFTYQILAFDTNGDGLSYFDNSSLFNIGNSGLISFTPVENSVSNITITIQDNSSCTNSNTTGTFQLTVSGEAPPTAPLPTIKPTPPEGGSLPRVTLSSDLDKINTTIFSSEEKNYTAKIKNTGVLALQVEVTNPFKELLTISPGKFTLLPSQEQELTIIINPQKQAPPGTYVGEIKLEGKSKSTFGATLLIPIFLEIQAKPEPRVEQPLPLPEEVEVPGTTMVLKTSSALTLILALVILIIILFIALGRKRKENKKLPGN